ncbi:MAG: hypothetical protein KKH28_13620 [Elusimicrobia bacterium]|nr:hypothetical protein [Elusimicrobiota bacterium]
MKIRPAIAAVLTIIFAVNLVFANTSKTAAAGTKAQAAATNNARTKEMKNILFKLVRQDEYLDEAIEILDSSTSKLTADDISALGLSLKLIKNNLEHLAALNKKQFSEVQPYTGFAIYTKTILSYSRKAAVKVGQAGELVSAAVAKGKKSAVRDAVSSKKGKKVKGKNLTQILEEQKAMEKLSADIRNLKASAKKLYATSRWLYIVSK